MSTDVRTLNPTKPAAGRRFRYALQSFALLFAVTACCVFGGILADRFPKRFDATATREHQLSKRTIDQLNALKGQYELVVAANFSGVDPQSARRTEDVLANFSRTSANVRTTMIDVGSARGIAELDALLARLIERSKPDLDKLGVGAEKAITNAALTSQALNSVSEELLAANQTVQDADPNAAAIHRFLTDSAAVCRVTAENLDTAQAKAKQLASTTIGRTSIPASEDAVGMIRKALANALGQLKEIGDGADAMTRAADTAVAPATRERVKPAAAAVSRTRDEIGRTITAIDDLPRTSLSSVARVLERSSAAIVLGPPGSAHGGVATLDVASLFPPAPRAGEQPVQIDLRARTEELLGSAISVLTRDDAPIVVLMHGAPTRLAPDFVPIAAVLDRLRMRGMILVEWPVALDSEPPSLTAFNPGGKRPVVYVTISTTEGTAEGAVRMSKLAKAVSKLIGEYKPVLLSVTPSTLPATGQKDPMVEFLEPLGVMADSGRPLLQQSQGAQGRVVTADLFFADPQADHVVSSAIRGLNTHLPWPIPLRTQSNTSGVTPILVTDNASRTIWAESEWLDFRRVPVRDRSLLANPPANDSSRDDGAGPWNLIVAIERAVAGMRQRLLVVGSNGWFLDEITQGMQVVDGRPVFYNPGNLELFEGGVFWLAGQESLIGASSQSVSVPLIPPMSAQMILILRWSLIAGVPLLILLMGAVWRLVRG